MRPLPRAVCAIFLVRYRVRPIRFFFARRFRTGPPGYGAPSGISPTFPPKKSVSAKTGSGRVDNIRMHSQCGRFQPAQFIFLEHRMRKRIVTLLLLTSALAFLPSCGGGPEKQAAKRSNPLSVGKAPPAVGDLSFGRTAQFDESAPRKNSGPSGLRTDSAELRNRHARRKRRGY